MSSYQEALQVMNKLFQKDYQFALATSTNNQPSVRFIDTYYEDGAFYIVTSLTSRKVIEIMQNRHVALTNRLYKFHGEGEVIGHPLEKKNEDIRRTLIKVFEPWYFPHNNEDDPNMCYVKINLTSGFYYDNGTGYRVDFLKKTAESFPYNFDIKPFS